jgi:hypothetical protein
LERDVVEIASLEQRRIAQDLHDTVGQSSSPSACWPRTWPRPSGPIPPKHRRWLSGWTRDSSAASKSFGASCAGCSPWRSIPRG